MIELFHRSSFDCSRRVTELYSTSFTKGIKALHKKFHDPIYAIYGFVRYADEIVDTFHDYDKQKLLNEFRNQTYEALENKISLNPILHAFQLTVHAYNIEYSLIEDFLHSMEMDLHNKTYKQDSYDAYIYGSAAVVGLMCLQVFCERDDILYQQLKRPAGYLGSAFQKINFLRDMKSDFIERGRVYFPEVDFTNFSASEKEKIEAEIEQDFEKAYQGILRLPKHARFGVYLAYKYYDKLFHKIRSTPAHKVIEKRIRVSNPEKLSMLAQTYFNSQILGLYLP